MASASLSRRGLLRQAAAAVFPAILRGKTRHRPNILFCISDDQSWIHTSFAGSKFVRTPAFDRVAGEGVYFHNCHVSAPSCGPSRASILTGQDFYRLGPAAINHAEWPRGTSTWQDLLAQAGYFTGFTGKGWGPGNWKAAGRASPPSGRAFNQVQHKPPVPGLSPVDYAGNFEAFLRARPKDAPFSFWTGFTEPHRVFDPGCGVRNGKRLDDVEVPAFLPDTPVVRSDLADYAFEIEWYDRQMNRILKLLDESGEAAHTVVVMTSDNGMAFPRAKGNLYDYGTHVPLAIRWTEGANGGRKVDDFVTSADLAPTLLWAAGLEAPDTMTGRSLRQSLTAKRASIVDARRSYAIMGMERHFPGSRPDGAGYPCRAIRTDQYLYIWNLNPERNPCGDRPGPVWPADDPVGGFGDIDGSPTKTELWQQRGKFPSLARLAFEPRPSEELYLAREDPSNMNNVIRAPMYAEARYTLRKQLVSRLVKTGDPRATGKDAEVDAILRRFPTVPEDVSAAETRRD